MMSDCGYQGVLGQERAKKLVTRTLASKRIPHALLFRGPEGVGKQLFARGLAAVVNCRNSELEACGQCSSCKKYHSGNHPDFTVVEPENGRIKIERIRELCKSLTYPPYESKQRVVLIEDVHTMLDQAANALLKTLEEPPENNLLILTADASRYVLPTILSRCQVVPFYPLSIDQTCEILMADARDIGKDEARVLARLSEGSPGKALLLKKAKLLGLLEKTVAFLEHPESSSPINVLKALKIAEECSGLKENLPAFLGLLRIWYRDLLLLENGQGKLVGQEELFYKNSAGERKCWNSAQLFAKLEAIDKAADELNRNCNRALVCEVLIFSLL